MPLVLAVLIIVVLILNARDSKIFHDRQSSVYAKDMRKTNAKLEQQKMDMYMKRGYSADDAFKKSYEDMIALGYEPCIPRKAYKENSSYCTGQYDSFDPEYYDSWLVKDRKRDIQNEFKRDHPDCPSSDDLEGLAYQNFPSNQYEYVRDIKRRGQRAKAEPIGSFIIYPNLGTCEVLAHNWIGDGSLGGTYTLRVLRDGRIVNYVKIGDSKIQRQDP